MRNCLVILSTLFFLISCQKEYQETVVDFSAYELEPGFNIQAVVAEPLIEAPVALSFDDSGTIWVLEMRGYMRSLKGLNEDAPVGRIRILQDIDLDGVADHAKTFMDSLKLGRALAHVYGGLLYAEPPNLYFTEITDALTPGKTVVVDTAYAVGGNVEHQPNGLLMNIDNWIYSAKASKRYRLKNGVWQVQKTSFRGQWGISHDAMGRLLYNDNSNQLQGDWIVPNIVNQNLKYNADHTIGKQIVDDQRVFASTATAVNRGYLPDMLHEDGKLKRFTSACGPVYFEGVGFPKSYQGNVFVCGPEANLIKRNIVNFNILQVSGKQAWENKEFLRSSDEAFRPVNLFNGPDGALYVVDMHRGIIQHKTYMTSYLREKYIKKGLDTIIGMGRILRISTKKDTFKSFDIKSLVPSQWVDSLSSENIWIRDRAQHSLITSQNESVIPKLQEIIQTSNNEIEKIHALYVLEGLGKLSFSGFNSDNHVRHSKFTSHMLKLMVEVGYELSEKKVKSLISADNNMIDAYLAYYLSKNPKASHLTYLVELIKKNNEEDWILEPMLSGIVGNEDVFVDSDASKFIPKTKKILDSLSEIQVKNNIDFVLGEDGLTQGRNLYNQHCATCHGADGLGINNLGPPLLNSEFVSEKKERLVAIMIYGLNGPITVNGKQYDNQNAMPGIGANTELTDEMIRDIGNFIRNAFTTSPQNITEKMVDSIRQINRSYDKTFTVKELNEVFSIN